MSVSVRAGGVLRPVAAIKVKVAGAERVVRTAKLMEGGLLRTVYSSAAPMSVAITPSPVDALDFDFFVTSVPATAQVTGGTGPFSYAWSVVETSSALPTIENPTFATTRFSLLIPGGGAELATFQCTVTDSLGNTASAEVFVSFVSL